MNQARAVLNAVELQGKRDFNDALITGRTYSRITNVLYKACFSVFNRLNALMKVYRCKGNSPNVLVF